MKTVDALSLKVLADVRLDLWVVRDEHRCFLVFHFPYDFPTSYYPFVVVLPLFGLGMAPRIHVLET